VRVLIVEDEPKLANLLRKGPTVQSDESVIFADQQRLEYALSNLVDNALTPWCGECGAHRSAHR
jgi:signal transduction histidine kinase